MIELLFLFIYNTSNYGNPIDGNNSTYIIIITMII